MEPSAFDDLARVVGSAVSRRRALQVAIAGVAGVLFPFLSQDDARAIKVGKFCNHPGLYYGHCFCCGNRCVNPLTDDNNCGACFRQCDTDQYCANGECTCLTPKVFCPLGDVSVCVDLSTDHDNCGRCGNACGTHAICCGGQCVVNDNPNCGACGFTCPRVCCNGQCCGELANGYPIACCQNQFGRLVCSACEDGTCGCYPVG
jgi:hypothetical protein